MEQWPPRVQLAAGAWVVGSGFGSKLRRVRAVSRLAWVGWLAATAAGCAAITGLDGISEQDCAPSCSDAATRDVTTDSPGDRGTPARPVPGDAAEAPGEAAALEAAATADDGAPQAAGEAGGGSTGEAGGPATADAAFDSGCGPLDTPENCSACTDTCASVPTVETSSRCSGDATGLGATCSYTCASGYQDCNAAEVPNLDGCECHVPGATQAQCCLGSGTCPVAHDNGLNQTSSKFFDCQVAGQLTLALATDACAAFTGDAGQCSQEVCESPDGSADGDLVICSSGSATDCVCWTYQGANAGYLHDAQLPPDQGCYCADSTLGDPTYE